MVQSERCQDLEEEETNRHPSRLGDPPDQCGGRGRSLGKANDSLTDGVRFGGARKRNQKYLDEKRTGDKGNVGNETQDTSAPPKPENPVIDGEGETGFLLARFLSPFLLALLVLTSDCLPDALGIG
jgi:hypothetical protein